LSLFFRLFLGRYPLVSCLPFGFFSPPRIAPATSLFFFFLFPRPAEFSPPFPLTAPGIEKEKCGFLYTNERGAGTASFSLPPFPLFIVAPVGPGWQKRAWGVWLSLAFFFFPLSSRRGFFFLAPSVPISSPRGQRSQVFFPFPPRALQGPWTELSPFFFFQQAHHIGNQVFCRAPFLGF